MKKSRRILSLLAVFVCFLAIGISAHAASKIYVNMNSNLRKGPGKDYKVSTTVKAGKSLNLTGDEDEDSRGVLWYEVSYNGKYLWISSKCASEVPKPTTSAKKRVITTLDSNLRKGPGLKYDSYVVVQEGSALKYLGKTKKDSRKVKWYKVSYYGKSLWVSSKNSVRKNSSSSKSVYVEEDAFLRKGPGKDYDDYTVVSEGTVLKYLGKTSKDSRKVKWYKVSYNNKSLWISEKTCDLR